MLKEKPFFAAALFSRKPDGDASAASPDLDLSVSDEGPAADSSGDDAVKPAECIDTKLIAAMGITGQTDVTQGIIRIEAAIEACHGNVLRYADACLAKSGDQGICHHIIGADNRFRHGEFSADDPLCILHRFAAPEISVGIVAAVIIQTVSMHHMEIGIQTVFCLRRTFDTGQTVDFPVTVYLYHVFDQKCKCLRVMRNGVFKERMLTGVQHHHWLSGMFQEIIQHLLNAALHKGNLVIDKAVKIR